MTYTDYKAIILGAGPAGTGPLVCAHQRGDLERLLDTGILIVDKSPQMGRGSIGHYGVNADTYTDTFLECLDRGDERVLARMRSAPITAELERYRGWCLPLRLVGEFMAELGAALRDLIDAHPRSQFWPETEAVALRHLPDGRFQVDLDTADGLRTVTADRVVSALGARQCRDWTVNSAIVPGVDLSAPAYQRKVMLTNEVLSEAWLPTLRSHLLSASNRKVVIIGASHSTTSTTWMLLNRTGIDFGPGDITLLHREPFRIFYPTREAALADGYNDFGEADFCPVTGRLYRLAGLRFDSRELVRQFLGVGDAPPETRVRVYPLDRTGQLNAFDLRSLLDEAALIVPAFGYRPNCVPLFAADGTLVQLLSENPFDYNTELPESIAELVSYASAPPLVDTECRVLAANGQVIPNLFATGLASGFRLTGKLGGEPSFRGQTNGVWLYQNGVGELILKQLMFYTHSAG